MSAEGGKVAILAALLANLGVAVTKFVAFFLTGASSMLAEGIHSVADSSNQVLLLFGGRQAQREATPEHPFGFGRERYIYSFLVAIVLFSIGGLFALYEAYHKWHEVKDGAPNELLDGGLWWVAVAVLLGAILMEGFSLRTAVHQGNRTRGETSWLEFIRRAKAPELPVILLEDFAALIGLTLALLGVGLSVLTSNGYFDVAGTAGIGLLLVSVAVVLGIETKSLLLGEAASPESQRSMRESLLRTDGVERVIHMRTMHLGPQELLVGVKIAVARSAVAADIASTINAAERAIREVEPTAGMIYVEPDIWVEEHRSDPRPSASELEGH